MNRIYKKTLKKDSRAVSPVIGVIMLIAIAVVIAVVVSAFAYSILGSVHTAPNAALVVEGATAGSTNVTIVHHGGEKIIDALSGGAWNALEVRMNGTTFSTNNAYLNGDAVNATALTADLRSGDELRLQIAWEVKTGDVFTLIYKPTEDVLQRVRVA